MVRINGNYEVQAAKTETNTVFENKERMESPEPLPLVQQGDDRAALEDKIAANEAKLTRLKASRDAIQVPKLPEAPKPDTVVDVKVKYGDTLTSIAAKYHCSVADIEKANPNLGELISDITVIKVPTVSAEKWKTYAALVEEKDRISDERDELDSQIRELENEVKVAKNTIRAQEIIGQIQSSKNFAHFDERYSFSVDPKTGNLCIKFKNPLVLDKVKKDFRLADGVILRTNGEELLKSFEERFVIGFSNYDDRIAPEGQVLQLPPFECTPRTR